MEPLIVGLAPPRLPSERLGDALPSLPLLSPSPMPTPHTQINLDAFNVQLAKEYAELFKSDPTYVYAASKMTPEALARKMTLALDAGTGNKDGLGIVRTCRYFKIAHTYKAIRAFLNGK